MRKPPLRRAQKERILTATHFSFRLELVLDYDSAVTIQRGREDARKLMDSLDLAGLEFEPDPSLGEAFLKCADLKRIVRVRG